MSMANHTVCYFSLTDGAINDLKLPCSLGATTTWRSAKPERLLQRGHPSMSAFCGPCSASALTTLTLKKSLKTRGQGCRGDSANGNQTKTRCVLNAGFGGAPPTSKQGAHNDKTIKYA